MIGEREYMHRNPFNKGLRAQYPALFWVLAVNVVVFFVEIFVSRLFAVDFINRFLSLSIEGLKSGFVWELFTYSVLHGGFFHLLLNMIAIFFIGRFVEEKLEKKNFLILYLMGVFFGGLFWALSTFLVSPDAAAILCGASAGSLALITFFCLSMPDRPLTFFLFFIIPINIRPKILLYILIGYELFSYATMEYMGVHNVANSAHLGGIFAAFLFYALFKIDFLDKVKSTVFKPKSMKMSASDLNYKVNFVDVEELKKEANRILDKVSKKGLNSLSEAEREILKQYREYI